MFINISFAWRRPVAPCRAVRVLYERGVVSRRRRRQGVGQRGVGGGGGVTAAEAEAAGEGVGCRGGGLPSLLAGAGLGVLNRC